MTCMDQLAQLRNALEKAENRAKRLMAQAHAAQKERDELETAIRVLERFAGQASGAGAVSSQGDKGQLIFSYVGVGQSKATAPKEIIDALRADGHDFGDDLVRTQLWRMAKRNELEKYEGRYWRPVILKDGDEDNAPNGSVKIEQEPSNDDWSHSDPDKSWNDILGDDDIPF
jgi:hypothetical protein